MSFVKSVARVVAFERTCDVTWRANAIASATKIPTRTKKKTDNAKHEQQLIVWERRWSRRLSFIFSHLVADAKLDMTI